MLNERMGSSWCRIPVLGAVWVWTMPSVGPIPGLAGSNQVGLIIWPRCTKSWDTKSLMTHLDQGEPLIMETTVRIQIGDIIGLEDVPASSGAVDQDFNGEDASW